MAIATTPPPNLLGATTRAKTWLYGDQSPSAPPAPRPFHEQDPWGEKTHTYVRAQGFGAAPDPAPGRWAGQRQWTIAELGTGTGCALACLVAAFERHAHPLQRLHYVGFERDPGMLDWWRDPAARAAIPPAERKALESILARPIRSTQGITRWRLLDGRATITLVLGDATQWLPLLSFRSDAWFLDAYEPAIEDRLWSPEVLAHVARLSAAGTTASTFSAAAVVRHGLHAAGFDVQRQAGFDTKRHMTTAVRRSHDASATIEPWFAPPEPAPPDRVTVMGAGLAGAWCARAFAERGAEVTVVEPTPGIALASDVPLAAAAQPGGSWQSEQVRVHDAAWHLLASRCVDLGLPHRVLPITTPGVAPNAPAGQPTRIARPASAGPTHAIAPDTPAGEPTRMAIVAAPREIISALLDHPRIRREPSMPSNASFVVQCTAFLPDAMTDAACARGAPVPNAGSIACASLVRPLDTAIMDRGYALPEPTAARAWVGATNHPGRWSPLRLGAEPVRAHSSTRRPTRPRMRLGLNSGMRSRQPSMRWRARCWSRRSRGSTPGPACGLPHPITCHSPGPSAAKQPSHERSRTSVMDPWRGPGHRAPTNRVGGAPSVMVPTACSPHHWLRNSSPTLPSGHRVASRTNCCRSCCPSALPSGTCAACVDETLRMQRGRRSWDRRPR